MNTRSNPDSERGTVSLETQGSNPKRKKLVLAISSGGGHWVQLQRLKPAFEGCRLVLSTTKQSYASDVPGCEFKVIPDCNRWSKIKLIRSAIGIAWLIVRTHPDVVVSTGAAPGYFAIRFGKLIGAKTVWVDSIANAEELSLSGDKAKKYADLWITQWEHLAKPEGPLYFGNVLS